MGPLTTNIGHSSPGAAGVNVSVSGTGINNPVITTPTSASITANSAVLGGNITNINHSNVSTRGVFWSVTEGFADGAGTQVSETGTYGTGVFTINVPGLSPNQIYYFKAFATNAAGTAYTAQGTFTTIGIPVITTPTSAGITTTTAVLGGNITNINHSNVTMRGIYWSITDGFADGTGTAVSETGSFGTGVFTLPVSGLTSNTVYYFKAFATNAAGTAYTAQATFRTATNAPVALPASAICHNGFTAHWEAAAGASSYRLDVLESDGITYVAGFQNLSVSLNIARVEFVAVNTAYKYRIRAFNGSTSLNSNVIDVSTTAVLEGTSASTSIAGAPANLYVTPVSGGPAFTNNDVVIDPVNEASSDFSIIVSWHANGYDTWPDARLICRISCSDNNALNGTYTVNYAGMGFTPVSAVYKWDGVWRYLSASYSATEATFALSGLAKGFRGEVIVAFDNGNGTLPVELSSFTAGFSAQGFVQLQWITQSETNVAGYRIYRNDSDDLETALMLNTFIDATNTSQMQIYVYWDKEIFEDGTYYYWLQNLDFDGSSQYHGPITITVTLTGEGTPQIPITQGIGKIYPNPFNPSTNIEFGVVRGGEISLAVYNTRGQLMRTLFSGYKDAGSYSLRWDGTDEANRSLSSGIYLLKLISDRSSSLRKLVLMK
ncbi:MAG: T9SS type A sorting domain-containing protein [Candidatus Cloacimonadaceae bacterium]|nr:T9SS type A sorting domain-containing protein [Candidatus Cloacimonadaceae bacterium]